MARVVNPEPGERVTTPWPGIEGEVDYAMETGQGGHVVVLIADDDWAWRVTLECRGQAVRDGGR